MLKILFLILMSGGIPVAIAMAGASLIYLFFCRKLAPLCGDSPHGLRH